MNVGLGDISPFSTTPIAAAPSPLLGSTTEPLKGSWASYLTFSDMDKSFGADQELLATPDRVTAAVFKVKDKRVSRMIACFLTPKPESIIIVTKLSVLNSLGITNSLFLSASLKKPAGRYS